MNVFIGDFSEAECRLFSSTFSSKLVWMEQQIKDLLVSQKVVQVAAIFLQLKKQSDDLCALN